MTRNSGHAYKFGEKLPHCSHRGNAIGWLAPAEPQAAPSCAIDEESPGAFDGGGGGGGGRSRRPWCCQEVLASPPNDPLQRQGHLPAVLVMRGPQQQLPVFVQMPDSREAYEQLGSRPLIRCQQGSASSCTISPVSEALVALGLAIVLTHKVVQRSSQPFCWAKAHARLQGLSAHACRSRLASGHSSGQRSASPSPRREAGLR